MSWRARHVLAIMTLPRACVKKIIPDILRQDKYSQYFQLIRMGN